MIHNDRTDETAVCKVRGDQTLADSTSKCCSESWPWQRLVSAYFIKDLGAWYWTVDHKRVLFCILGLVITRESEYMHKGNGVIQAHQICLHHLFIHFIIALLVIFRPWVVTDRPFLLSFTARYHYRPMTPGTADILGTTSEGNSHSSASTQTPIIIYRLKCLNADIKILSEYLSPRG